MRSEVYLDHNASAPVRPEARAAVLEAMGEGLANPSSIHARGHRAKILIEAARESVAALLGARAEEIVFTSGGTESNNLALLGAARKRGRGHLVVSAVEHSSVLEAASELERQGWRVTRVPPDSEGRVDAGSILASIEADTFVVSLMHSNHEVGVLQDVTAVAEALRDRGILRHCDAVQSAGKIPLERLSREVDLVSISGHKIGSPSGVGCLWIRAGVELSPLLFGGPQEANRRAGTPALAMIAGFGVAAKIACLELHEEARRLRPIRDALEAALISRWPQVRIHGAQHPRLPNTLNFALPGCRGEDLVAALDLEGIAVSTGSACTAGTVRPSHVLQAMGCAPAEAEASLRVSLGRGSVAEHVGLFMEAMEKIVDRAQSGGTGREALASARREAGSPL